MRSTVRCRAMTHDAVSPFQGGFLGWCDRHPGRCPGLLCHCPFGASRAISAQADEALDRSHPRFARGRVGDRPRFGLARRAHPSPGRKAATLSRKGRGRLCDDANTSSFDCSRTGTGSRAGEPYMVPPSLGLRPLSSTAVTAAGRKDDTVRLLAPGVLFETPIPTTSVLENVNRGLTPPARLIRKSAGPFGRTRHAALSHATPMPTILSFNMPTGTATSATSPTFLPTSPWPIGLVSRILFWS